MAHRPSEPGPKKLLVLPPPKAGGFPRGRKRHRRPRLSVVPQGQDGLVPQEAGTATGPAQQGRPGKAIRPRSGQKRQKNKETQQLGPDPAQRPSHEGRLYQFFKNFTQGIQCQTPAKQNFGPQRPLCWSPRGWTRQTVPGPRAPVVAQGLHLGPNHSTRGRRKQGGRHSGLWRSPEGRQSPECPQTAWARLTAQPLPMDMQLYRNKQAS
jgi:hypothetical protein